MSEQQPFDPGRLTKRSPEEIRDLLARIRQEPSDKILRITQGGYQPMGTHDAPGAMDIRGWGSSGDPRRWRWFIQWNNWTFGLIVWKSTYSIGLGPLRITYVRKGRK